jgi:hypothetical protein
MRTGLSEARQGPANNVFAWIVTILICLYLAWTGFSIYRSTGAFASMYSSLDAPLPWKTDFLIHHYHWLYPCLFGGAGSLVITQHFFVRSKLLNIGISLAAAAVFGMILSEQIVKSLYAPVWLK